MIGLGQDHFGNILILSLMGICIDHNGENRGGYVSTIMEKTGGEYVLTIMEITGGENILFL